MRKIKTIVTGIFFAGIFLVNLIVMHSGNSKDNLLNLNHLKLASASTGEESGGKYELRQVNSGSAPETATLTIDGVTRTYTRTCKYIEVRCIGTGDIDCTPSFNTYSCTEWE